MTESAQSVSAPLFTAAPTVLVRSPDPAKLAAYYSALGFRAGKSMPNGAVYFYLEESRGSLEILPMDPTAKTGIPKTSRTQQGVLVIFETTDLEDVVRRATAAGSPMIEKYQGAIADLVVYYIADPEYNILGFARRHHNPSIRTP